ncbi:hypothetical protein CRUP_018451 [Coryphaenoides rupestris]|nr:hypothetical protein CRUP_018451 [Coryphaenoides rupestris]
MAFLFPSHADGTVKFWDASASKLLYKLKTAKVFERSRSKEDKGSMEASDEDPYAIQTMAWCPESRMLCVSGTSGPPSQPSTSSNNSDGGNVPCLKYQSPGYQVDLVVQLVWVSGEPPQQITSLALNSSYGLVVFGNSNGLAVVDYIQRSLLLNLSTVELYGSNDPYQRQPRSPRKARQPSGDHRDNSFSRSRSSSVTSIDKESRESIASFHFCDTFVRKGDCALTPSLYVGTSLGTVLAVALTLPPAGEQRQLQPGSIMRMAFLDSAGMLLPPTHEPWCEPNAVADGEDKGRKRRPVSVSPSASQDLSESQYTVVCSEKQAKVLSLPSQTCVHKHSITEASFILRADVVQMSSSVCLACFCANGHIMTLSLPGLRPLLDVNYLPLTDMRIARTFCFTHLGQAMYLTSPTEVQRITYSQDTCENLQHIPGPGGLEGMKGAASGVIWYHFLSLHFSII